MEKCKKLKEYAQYIARVRAFLDVGFDIETAIDRATDLEKATMDIEYCETLYKEFSM